MPETTETFTRLYLENLSLIRDATLSSNNYSHAQRPSIAILTDRLLTQNDNMLRFLMENVQNNNQGRRTNRDGRRYSYTYDSVVSPRPTQNPVFPEGRPTATAPDNFFLPIEIYPTTLQIETATINRAYGTIDAPLNASCPISLEPFLEDEIVTMIRFCNHVFKPDQINIWFQHNCRCPVCRYDIRDYIPGISGYESDDSDEEEETPPNETNDSNDELSINGLSRDHIRTITENILNNLTTAVATNEFSEVDDSSNNVFYASYRLSLRN
uniref:RING-type domain-containing protein n=1 Tax=viral metagenome TaxID=1070528 RepID=A0A6C0LLR8_9ZZZZ